MEELKKFYSFLDLEISACGGKRADFLKSIKEDLKPCRVVSIKDIFTKEQIKLIRSLVQKKECFKNAYQIASFFEFSDTPVEYVEGRVLVCDFLPIEHAWNKIGDRYFDATFELALGYDVTKEEYAKLKEYDVDKVREILLDRKYWGEIYREEKATEFFK